MAHLLTLLHTCAAASFDADAYRLVFATNSAYHSSQRVGANFSMRIRRKQQVFIVTPVCHLLIFDNWEDTEPSICLSAIDSDVFYKLDGGLLRLKSPAKRSFSFPKDSSGLVDVVNLSFSSPSTLSFDGNLGPGKEDMQVIKCLKDVEMDSFQRSATHLRLQVFLLAQFASQPPHKRAELWSKIHDNWLSFFRDVISLRMAVHCSEHKKFAPQADECKQQMRDAISRLWPKYIESVQALTPGIVFSS